MIIDTKFSFLTIRQMFITMRRVQVVDRQGIDQAAWDSVNKILYVPHTEAEYNRLVGILDQLIDQVGEDETHPLASLMEVIGVLVERCEDKHVPEITES